MTQVFVSEILCGGGWVEPARATGWAPALLGEAWAMLSAITADFATIPGLQVVTLLDQRLTHRSLDPRVQTIRVNSTREPLAFRELASQSDFALVIAPEIDGVLHQRCLWAQEAGARLLGPSPDAVALTSDKLALDRHWQAVGVPTPVSLPFTDASPPFPPPWIVKPRWGAGSQGIEFIPPHPQPLSPRSGGRGEEESPLPTPPISKEGRKTKCRDFESPFGSQAHSVLPSPPASGGEGLGVRADGSIIQPLIPGQPASVAFLIGPRQTIALPPCWQHLDDKMHYFGGSTPIPPEYSFRARSVASAAISSIPGLFGYVGVDVLLGEQDMAIEINPRLTTSYIGLRQLSKSNLAEAMLRIVQGQDVALSWGDSPVTWNCPEPEA
jgi:predicted ATP-grasp superfamily ATP-dependent carboligase